MLKALILFLWGAFVITEPVQATDENSLKVAYLFNICQLVEWPTSAFASNESDLKICVNANPGFVNMLHSLEKKKYNERHFVVTPIGQNVQADCNVLFVENIHNLNRNVLTDRPILTISDMPGAAEAGIAIEFVQTAGKLRWMINLDTTRQANLKISSKLIEIATSVIGQ